jgi:FkbM family methyltransferase
MVNRVGRSIIKGVSTRMNSLLNSAMLRWPVAGVLDLNIDGVPCRFYAECDDGPIDSFYYGRTYAEENDLRIFLELAKRSTVILDIGANTGLYAVLCAKASPAAEVFAFEPYDANLSRLRRNCELNDLTNVQFLPMAVGSANDPIEFMVPTPRRIIDVASVNEEFSRRVYGSAVEWEKVIVEQITVDDFKIKFSPDKRIELMKIDVELNEINVFHGMTSVLTNDRPDILVEIFVDDERKNFFESILKSFDYSAYTLLANGMLRADDGFRVNKDGLNFLLSPRKTDKAFTPYTEMESFYPHTSG